MRLLFMCWQAPSMFSRWRRYAPTLGSCSGTQPQLELIFDAASQPLVVGPDAARAVRTSKTKLYPSSAIEAEPCRRFIET